MSVFKECGAFGKFRNAGQACTAINRFIIEESKLKEATNFLLEASKNIKVGDGFNADSTIGPIITEESLNRILGLIEDATKKGAKVLTGEVKHYKQFLEPVVLADVTPEMRIFNEEIFGPVVSIIKAKSDEEVLTIANQTDYGLAAYVFSKHQGQKFAKRLDFGMVGINMVYLALVQAPFGGIKNSGFGREGGREGVREFLKIKYIGEVSYVSSHNS
jgi:succinate-semialdehyde dehydrogenase/glutarate-semialdehyde dehydrogenase